MRTNMACRCSGRNSCVLVGEDVGLVLDLIEGSLELPRIAINGILIHDAVVHHDRQAIDETCLRNVFCLEEAWAVGGRLCVPRDRLRRRRGDCSQCGGTKKIALSKHFGTPSYLGCFLSSPCLRCSADLALLPDLVSRWYAPSARLTIENQTTPSPPGCPLLAL